jgi:glucose-6-phosphate isomerase
MTNAHSARPGSRRRVAPTSRAILRIDHQRGGGQCLWHHTTFGFWDWVGGRYSVWSAIGLPLAIAIGAQAFATFWPARMPWTSISAPPLAHNLPVRWACWTSGTATSTALPAAASRRTTARCALSGLSAATGDGKQRQAGGRPGQPLPLHLAVLWGEPGTNGQHAYFQMLHQGTDVVPVEFVAVKGPPHLPGHHDLLLANVLAQAQALMLGKDDAGGHKDFTGNRPSTFLLLDELSPTSLGALIALQEHRVFVSGSLWGINSFDQWGVELGKVLAKMV